MGLAALEAPPLEAVGTTQSGAKAPSLAELGAGKRERDQAMALIAAASRLL